ncbi:response regulator transcription factor [Pseudanabaena sp. FACHB-2040]|uniref:response regulator n=1 Tax=Pseudanabaena sp. FACHB-2040 TaxID=2692859 RepID=UPI0016828386|nr:response regulator transcription factor [Pseudanabaena sp. FACHB-2040]MBD2257561.1 response regulator transcription factor [Pseudanabaena sp. FACHB-2040]
MQPIRVLLADNHTLIRAGLRSLLESMEAVEVVAEASDGRAAIHLVKAHQPDVVLMDVAMPEMNGLEATARIVKEFPNTHVMILSMHANEEYVMQALQAGAMGYVLKDAGVAELELALKSISKGEAYLSPAVSKHVIADYVRRTGGESSTPSHLTPRQREILQLLVEGHSAKEIAARLVISIKTVETHRSQIMERLDIHDVAGLVRYAIRTGLVTADE